MISEQEQIQYEMGFHDGYQQALKEMDSNKARIDAKDPITLESICEKYGLTPKGVDYALQQYQTIICEITHGTLSKLTYSAKTVLDCAQERWCDTCDLKAEKERT